MSEQRRPRRTQRPARQPVDGAALRARLLNLMQTTGLSARRIAEQIGRSENVISQFVAGTSHSPSPETCRRLAAEFGWPEDVILVEAGHRTAQVSADPGRQLRAVLAAWPCEPTEQTALLCLAESLRRAAEERRAREDEWRRRFDAVVAEVLGMGAELVTGEGLVGVGVGGPITDEQWAALEAATRTEAGQQWVLIRERLFPNAPRLLPPLLPEEGEAS